MNDEERTEEWYAAQTEKMLAYFWSNGHVGIIQIIEEVN
jgi:hypothetical protein